MRVPDFRKVAGEIDEAIRALESRDVSGFVERREGGWLPIFGGVIKPWKSLTRETFGGL